MDEPAGAFEELVDRSVQYAHTTLEIIKLRVIDRLSQTASDVVSWFVVAIFALLFFIFLNTGIALLIGAWLGAASYGFFVVAGFYGLIALICVVFRKRLLKRPVRDAIINDAILEQNETDERDPL